MSEEELLQLVATHRDSWVECQNDPENEPDDPFYQGADFALSALADDLRGAPVESIAARLGRTGGLATARNHAPDHFKKLAAMRKNCKGGRPRKVTR